METGTITRKANLSLDKLKEEFCSLYTKNDFERQIKELNRVINLSRRPAILGELFLMFDRCGISYKENMNNAYYERIVKKAKLPSYEEQQDRMLYKLYQLYKNYLPPQAYMHRLADQFSFAEDDWTRDSLRVRILKQFIKYGNYLTDAGYSGKTVIQEYVGKKLWKRPNDDDVLACVDDELFQVLISASKPQKKPGGKFGLLKLADDLAGGNFGTGAAAKKGLYLFAMVFGMTYYSGAEGEEDRYARDIEKNIFSYYGISNYMGINYKNFAEMIYLYFLNSDYPPAEKIRRACAMIERLCAEEKGKSRPELLARKKRSVKLKAYFVYHSSQNALFSEDILNQSEAEFAEFIRKNYYCNTVKPAQAEKESYCIGEMQVEERQGSAEKQYRKIEENSKELEEWEGKTNCTYGLCCSLAGLRKTDGRVRIRLGIPEDEWEKFDEFIGQMEKLDQFLAHWDRKIVSRGSLLAAFYYYYNAENEAFEKKGRTFEAVFNDFRKKADVFLDRAGYPRISGKNLLDLLLIFSSYVYLY